MNDVIATLRIRLELDGEEEVSAGLNKVNSSAKNLNKDGLSEVLHSFNEVRWALLAVSEVIKAAEASFKFLAGIAKAEFTFVSESIKNLVIAPLKLAMNTATEFGVVAGTAMAAFGSASLTQFGDFQEQMINTRKTAGLSASELESLSEKITALSLTTETSAIDLGKIAAAAGQLGITGEENILGFTKAINNISIATGVAAESAANSFGRMAAAAGLPMESQTFDRMGDVLNELENTTAASTQDMIDGLQNVGGAAAVLGIGFEKQAALIATVISTGFVAPRSAGTSLRRFFEQVISKSEDVAKIMGTTSTVVKQRISEDAVSFMKDFLIAVNKTGNEAEIMGTMFDISGAKAAQAGVTLLNNWGAAEVALKSANTQWEKGGSVIQEVELQLQGANSQLKQAVNYWDELKRAAGEKIWNNLGTKLAGVKQILLDMIPAITNLSDYFSSKLGDALSFIITKFQTFINSKSFTDFVNSIKQNSDLLIASFQNVAMTILNFLQTNLPSAITIAKTYIAALFSFFEGVDVKSSLDAISSSFKSIANAVSGNSFQPIIDLFNSLGGIVGTTIQKVNEFVKALVSVEEGDSALTKIIKRVGEFYSTIAGNISKIDTKKIVDALVNVADILLDLAERTNVWLAVLIRIFEEQAMQNALKGFGKFLVDLTGVIAVLTTGVIAAFGLIVNVISAVISPLLVVVNLFQLLWDLMTGKGQKAWDKFDERLKDSVETINKQTEDLLSSIGGLSPGMTMKDELLGKNSISNTKETSSSVASSYRESNSLENLSKNVFSGIESVSISSIDNQKNLIEGTLVPPLVQWANEGKEQCNILTGASVGFQGGVSEFRGVVNSMNAASSASSSASKGGRGMGADTWSNLTDLQKMQAQGKNLGNEGRTYIGDTDITDFVKGGGIVSRSDKFIRDAYDKMKPKSTSKDDGGSAATFSKYINPNQSQSLTIGTCEIKSASLQVGVK